jgi:hypothetical protein
MKTNIQLVDFSSRESERFKEKLKDIVFKNNQNTLLLNREFVFPDDEEKNVQSKTDKHKMIAFQADTRIFFFDFGKDGYLTDKEEKERLDICQNLLLMIYVAPLIRIMQMSISFFDLLDNTSFAVILLLLFGGDILKTADRSEIGNIFSGPLGSDTAIMIAVFSDLMHYILHSSTRLWNLGRVDLPLVLSLYMAYVIIMWRSNSNWLYWYLLSFRFGSYYVSTCCNYWEDVVVLKIIRKLKDDEDFKLPSFLHKGVFLSELLDKFAFPLTRLDQQNKDALNVFKGSFCCWNWSRSGKSFMEKYHGDKQQKVTSMCGHVIFIPGAVIAILTSIFLVVVLIILVTIPLSIAYFVAPVLKFCCKRCGKRFGLRIYDEINLW